MWIVFTVFSGSRNNTDKSAPIDEEIIKKLVQKAKEHQQQHEGAIEHDHLKEKKNDGMPPPDDHDHPKEELKKAEEQNRNPGGKIQVNAPVKHDLNAPGEHIQVKFKLFSSRFSIILDFN